MSEKAEPLPAPPKTPPPRPSAPAEVHIAGVRLHPAARTIEVDAGRLTLRPGDLVVVEDRHGLEVATVSVASAPRRPHGPLRRALRLAEDRDLQSAAKSRERAACVLALARERVRARQAPIKMFRAELERGGGKVTLYFSSENRVDFRELLRDLSADLRMRIELRQVGVRDEAKMVGGIGSCGLELCCTTFLPHFAPVSIKMAKHQSLALNPTRVSGQCGRLKCCLVYEDAVYVEAGKALPKVGKKVETPDGVGRVGDLDVLTGKIRVYFEGQPPRMFAADDVRPVGGGPPAGSNPDDPDEAPSDPRG